MPTEQRAPSDPRDPVGHDGEGWPLVSVVIPAFQAERFLADAIESVAAQTYPAIETIVVDDGSTDGSAGIAARAPGVRCLKLGTNRGVCVARNAGIEAATGTYVALMDADDIMLTDRIAAQVAYLLEHPGCGCVLARHELFVEGGGPVPDWVHPDAVYGDPGGIETGSAVLLTELARKVPFDPSYELGHGVEWMGRLEAAGGPVEVCDRILIRRRIHDSNLSNDRAALRRDMLRMARDRVHARPVGPG